MSSVFDSIDVYKDLTENDVIKLLEIENESSDYYKLIDYSKQLAIQNFHEKGYVFTQIGINNHPCSGECQFCSLSKSNYRFDQNNQFELSTDDILQKVKELDIDNISALFIMTTADYSKDKILHLGKIIKPLLPNTIKLVINTGDFDEEYAMKLKKVGFDAAYHVVRLKESQDTHLSIENRIQTLKAIQNSGMELFYCIEPIGIEHTYKQIAKEIIRAKELGVNVMAVMKRVNVKGTRFENFEMISDQELAKIAAITHLCVKPKTSMNVHEPNEYVMKIGINQLYAEIGINPRDDNINTEKNRGKSVLDVKKMIEENGFFIRNTDK